MSETWQGVRLTHTNFMFKYCLDLNLSLQKSTNIVVMIAEQILFVTFANDLFCISGCIFWLAVTVMSYKGYIWCLVLAHFTVVHPDVLATHLTLGLTQLLKFVPLITLVLLCKSYNASIRLVITHRASLTTPTGAVARMHTMHAQKLDRKNK